MTRIRFGRSASTRRPAGRLLSLLRNRKLHQQIDLADAKPGGFEERPNPLIGRGRGRTKLRHPRRGIALGGMLEQLAPGLAIGVLHPKIVNDDVIPGAIDRTIAADRSHHVTHRTATVLGDENRRPRILGQSAEPTAIFLLHLRLEPISGRVPGFVLGQARNDQRPDRLGIGSGGFPNDHGTRSIPVGMRADEGFVNRRGLGIIAVAMWCEEVVRNAAGDGDFSGRTVDYVDIQWDQRRSTLKARSRGGEEVRVLLARGHALRHGDVLFEDPERAVVINVLPCEVVVVRSAEPRLMAELALELGNLHWPTEVTETEIIFLVGPEALAAAQRLKLEVFHEIRRFDPLPILATVVRSGRPVRILRSEDDNQAGQ